MVENFKRIISGDEDLNSVKNWSKFENLNKSKSKN